MVVPPTNLLFRILYIEKFSLVEIFAESGFKTSLNEDFFAEVPLICIFYIVKEIFTVI